MELVHMIDALQQIGAVRRCQAVRGVHCVCWDFLRVDDAMRAYAMLKGY